MLKARFIPTVSRLAGVAIALAATPALAAGPSGRELTDWLARNTDLSPAQIAIVAPEYVYSLKPLGSPLPTGDVMALVRTEVRVADWGQARGFQSWEANLLFDCHGRRVRILKSTVYSQPNRRGDPKAEPVGGDWFAPEAPQPATQLLAAACDPGFVWPLRTKIASAAPAPAKRTEAAPPKVETRPEPVVVAAQSPPPTAKPAPEPLPAEPTPEAKPQVVASAPAPEPQPVAPPPAAALSPQYAIQIAYSSSEAGVRHALAQARTTLGPNATDLNEVMKTTEVGRNRKRPRYTGLLSGFAAASTAERACVALRKAGQDCVVRPPAPDAPPIAAPSLPPTAVAAEAQAGAYFVQIARGPSEAGAKKALVKARQTLGPLADGLSDATDAARVGHRKRYTARLTGFPTAAAAAAACSKLKSAGRACVARP